MLQGSRQVKHLFDPGTITEPTLHLSISGHSHIAVKTDTFSAGYRHSTDTGPGRNLVCVTTDIPTGGGVCPAWASCPQRTGCGGKVGRASSGSGTGI